MFRSEVFFLKHARGFSVVATAKKPAAASKKKRAPRPGLSATERIFVAQYLIDHNGTRAYCAAHPKAKRNSARVQANRLLMKPAIRAAIDAADARTVAKLELTRDRIAQETARIALFDPRKLLNADGTPKKLHELDDDTAACVAGIEVAARATGRGKSAKSVAFVASYKTTSTADKNAALERGAKLLGMFEKDNAQRVDPILSLLKGMSRSSFPLAGAVTPDDDDG